MKRDQVRQRIRGQLYLSTMLNLTDAAYCVARSPGAGLVQLGTMLIAPDTEAYAAWKQRWPKGFLPYDPAAMRRALADELACVRAGLGGALICLSIGGFDVNDVLMGAEAFQAVGGDLVELNAHGSIQPFVEQGYLGGMALPPYRQRLVQWVESLSRLDMPLLVKFNARLDLDWVQVFQDLAHLPVAGYHLNVRDEGTKQPNYRLVERLRPLVKGALLCSGYAWTSDAVQRLFALGADAVGVAMPVMEKEDFLPALRRQLGGFGHPPEG